MHLARRHALAAFDPPLERERVIASALGADLHHGEPGVPEYGRAALDPRQPEVARRAGAEVPPEPLVEPARSLPGPGQAGLIPRNAPR